jgi:hypothetical protein
MRTHTCLYAGIAAITLTAACQASASGAYSFEYLVKMKEHQLSRFAAAYDEAIESASKSYIEALSALQDPDKPEAVRSAAEAEQERFINNPHIPEETDENLPDEINAERDKFRRDNLQADQTRLRRTVGVFETHINELTRLQERQQNVNPDDPALAAIQQEIDKTRRQLTQLRFAEPKK